MKIRSGFVSNSSSSSFVILRDAISNNQLDMIINMDYWIREFINRDENNGGSENLMDKFCYYESDPWSIEVNDDYVFGETSMDNFNIGDFLDYIKVDRNYIKWDDGYNDEPYQTQLDFIKNMKNSHRKEKINKLNDLNL